ncbi:hypothetical protein ACFOU0_02735 [Salinicoccus sesuvii]|uniref:Uncharacterized protein n=1 Tax=Salinicoccus sesuvii TaxID=868281 RepID=A0ABV7N2M8_9STAP
MEFNTELDKVEMKVRIEELENEKAEKVVNLKVEDLDSATVDLSNNSVDEVKELFDSIYEYIISHEKLIVFNLINAENTLFVEVAKDLVEHLNHEIEQSEENFSQLIRIQKDTVVEA